MPVHKSNRHPVLLWGILLWIGLQRAAAFATISTTKGNLNVSAYHDPYAPLLQTRRPSLRLENQPSSGEESADDGAPPVSRFVRALYKGLTFPFPTLRKLTLEGPPRDSQKKAVRIGFSVREATAAIAVYLALGAISYHSVLQAPDGQLPWSFIDALYFSVVTFTTVGYGDLCPVTRFGKLFTILFGISGISLLGVAIGAIGSRMAEIEDHMLEKARKASRERFKGFWNGLAENGHFKHRRETSKKEILNDSTIGESISQTGTAVPKWRQTLKSVFKKSVPAFAVILLGGATLGRIEGWSLMDSIYYAFITAVTLGYGDFSPTSKAGRICAIVFIPLAVAAAGDVLGNVATTLQERRQELFYESLMEEELDMDRLMQMDTTRNGKVSREEYVEFMLKEMGLVSEEEFTELYSQFSKLDKDGNGFLDKDDLQARVNQQTSSS